MSTATLDPPGRRRIRLPRRTHPPAPVAPPEPQVVVWRDEGLYLTLDGSWIESGDNLAQMRWRPPPDDWSPPTAPPAPKVVLMRVGR